MKHGVSAALMVIGSVATATAALADDSVITTAQTYHWEFRLRGIYLAPAQDSSGYAPLKMPENAIHVNDKWIPDLDVEYFFTPHWSTELVLTYPQKQTVTLERSALGYPVEIGSFKHLPPTLTLKYNFLPGWDFQPYIGAGLNVASIMDTELQVPTVGRLNLDHTTVGAAAQAGFDYRLAEHWFLNADFKWLELRSAVRLGITQISQARIDPVLMGVGIGYRFGG